MADPICFNCKRLASEIGEYRVAASEVGITAAAYVRREEGTYNPVSDQFCCTDCYVKLGMPVGPAGTRWTAP